MPGWRTYFVCGGAISYSAVSATHNPASNCRHPWAHIRGVGKYQYPCGLSGAPGPQKGSGARQRLHLERFTRANSRVKRTCMSWLVIVGRRRFFGDSEAPMEGYLTPMKRACLFALVHIVSVRQRTDGACAVIKTLSFIRKPRRSA